MFPHWCGSFRRFPFLSLGCFIGRAIPARPIPTIPVAIILLVARLIPATIAFIATFEMLLLRLATIIIARIFRSVEIIAFIIAIVFRTAVALLLLLLPGAIVGEHAEIMIGKLQIIFRIHPVARHLGVTSHILVFFQKLDRVAACAAINPVAAIATAPVTAAGTSVIVVPAAIPATGLPVVDQELVLAFTLPSFTENIVQSLS
ncbi:hypothetical protein TomTYG45_04760 [Sphingobium sp. TomTYG45]